jgi:hypothetical protein
MAKTSFYSVTNTLSPAEKVRIDLADRRDAIREFNERIEVLEQEHGRTLDGMNGDQLRLLFDAAFKELAEFEWGLKTRRGKVVKPQRAALLEALLKQESFA